MLQLILSANSASNIYPVNVAPKFMPEPRVVLVTGASSGFGQETAALLSQRGFRVFGTSRKPSGQPGDAGYDMVRLDVDSDESVNSCVKALLEKAGRLDVLVNNAGFALTGGIEETSIEEAKAQFETNFFGAARMVRACLPAMRKKGSGQIINISSIAAELPVPFRGYYAAAKAALIAYSWALRHEVMSLGLKVSVVEPGFFHTRLAETRRATENRINDYDLMRTRAAKALEKYTENGGDPKLVAEKILQIIMTRSPRGEYLVGKSGRYRASKLLLPASMFERGVRRRYNLD
jgi:NAD(P)-dependent dehydrogenase (short-subunit alcohol dehydrogenase family)